MPYRQSNFLEDHDCDSLSVTEYTYVQMENPIPTCVLCDCVSHCNQPCECRTCIQCRCVECSDMPVTDYDLVHDGGNTE